MGFSRHEYWSELPFSPPGDLPNPGIEPGSPALAGRLFTTEPPGGLNKQKENKTEELTPSEARQTKALEMEAEKGLRPSVPQHVYSFSSKPRVLLPMLRASWLRQ